jgi:hypothetical protein
VLTSVPGDEAVILELCDVLFDDGRVPDALYDRALPAG